MKKLYTFLFLVLPLTVFAGELIRGPYVEDPTLTTAVVRWSTNVPAQSWLEYGPKPKCNQIMSNSPAGIEHRVTLNGLASNKEYCYKVYVLNNRGDGVQSPAEGSFKTLYSPERKMVKFVIFGNTAGGGALTRELADKAAGYNPDFFIHTGNLVTGGLAANVNAEFFTPFAPALRKAPMFIAVSDKEYGEAADKQDNKNFFRQNYSRYHAMSWSRGSPNFFSFDTANARFIFLDASATEGAAFAPAVDKDSPQYAWLKNALSTTESGKWKIVVMHAAPYSTGAKGSNLEAREAFSNLFEYYGVNVVFQGADFDYERTFPIKDGVENLRGVPYMTFGTGAAPEVTKREHPQDWTARFYSGQVYGVGEIVDRKLTLKVYSMDDKLIETAEIYM
ncbi:MAG: metallophosphoesterase [Elusimicrobium sp.]|jgi:hypothetical protein|nr:metallophosphoesterase [Elusimicrobium sp.]